MICGWFDTCAYVCLKNISEDKFRFESLNYDLNNFYLKSYFPNGKMRNTFPKSRKNYINETKDFFHINKKLPSISDKYKTSPKYTECLCTSFLKNSTFTI